MSPLSIHEMTIVSGGALPLPLICTAAGAAHHIGEVIGGEEFSPIHLLASALAGLTVTPILSDAGVGGPTFKEASSWLYAAGFHGYIKALILPAPTNEVAIDSLESATPS